MWMRIKLRIKLANELYLRYPLTGSNRYNKSSEIKSNPSQGYVQLCRNNANQTERSAQRDAEKFVCKKKLMNNIIVTSWVHESIVPVFFTIKYEWCSERIQVAFFFQATTIYHNSNRSHGLARFRSVSRCSPRKSAAKSLTFRLIFLRRIWLLYFLLPTFGPICLR